jgi:hypothetical protein
MQAEFQAKLLAEQEASASKFRAEMQELIVKGLAQTAATVAVVAQSTQATSSSSAPVSKKRSRDATEDLEDGQIPDVPAPKKSRPSNLALDNSSRHRIPERREDRERRPRTEIEKMYSSRRDSPVTRRFDDNDRGDKSIRGLRDSYYDRREVSRDYRERSEYYRRDKSARHYDDRRNSDYRY